MSAGVDDSGEDINPFIRAEKLEDENLLSVYLKTRNL